MIKKIIVTLIIIGLTIPVFSVTSVGKIRQGEISEGNVSVIYRNVTVYAPAVASTGNGYVGVISTITVTIQSNGSGRVFVDTLPLTQVDMQGSARLAVKVASNLVENDKKCNIAPSNFDYFFVVRTSAPIIGGPSAGAIMTVATVAVLENWSLDDKTVMTGMINPDGSIGPIGGIPQKIDAAHSVGATRFLIPAGQGTYTEFEGWNLVKKSVADYAMNKYGIQVLEVSEINQAIENFTGYSFSFEKSDSEITTEDYIESMKPLATKLLDEAKQKYKNASSKFENTTIPNRYYRNGVKERLENAKTSLKESEEWYNQHLYYTSTSKSFQSLISSRFVNYSCEYYEPGDENFIQNLLEETNNIYNKTSEIAKKAEITDYISLQCVGAAQRRATEAKNYLDSLNTNFFTVSDLLDFFYNIAFIIERCNSISWWIGIGDHFNKTGNLTNTTIENLALEYIDEAQQAVIYSKLLLSEMGATYGDSANYLNSAQQLLETSQNDLDKGYPAAALFEALEALVKANLALEIIGTNAENKINFTSEKASDSISKSRKMGIEPVLAVSYYEYAESLSNETSYDTALIYYKYSGMIAGALTFANISTATSSSRFVGIPETEAPVFRWILQQTALLLGMFLIGILAGLGIGLIIAGLTMKKDKKKPSKKPSTHIQSTTKQDYRYPGNQIPRSIKDYYKKNK